MAPFFGGDMKKLIYIVIPIMLFSLVTPIAHAALSRSVPGSFVVTVFTEAPVTDIEFYTDAQATSLLPMPIAFGDIEQGCQSSLSFYVKNTGNTVVALNIAISGAFTGANVSASPGSMTLNPGDVNQIIIQAFIDSDAPLGEQVFSVEVFE